MRRRCISVSLYIFFFIDTWLVADVRNSFMHFGTWHTCAREMHEQVFCLFYCSVHVVYCIKK